MNLKRNAAFFKQKDIWRLIGAALMIIGLLWFWLGWSAASYYGPCVMVPAGLVMFLVTSARHVPESEIRQNAARATADVGADVTQGEDFSSRVLRNPAPFRVETWCFGDGATAFRRGKDNQLVSDAYAATALFCTREALLVRGRTVNLSTGEAKDTSLNIAWAQIQGAEVVPYEQKITLTNTRGSTATAHGAWLHIIGVDGDTLCRLPVMDDMDAQAQCENVNRRCSTDT